MVGADDDDGVIGLPRLGQRFEHKADLIIDKADRGVIGAARGQNLGVRHIIKIKPADMAQPQRMGVLGVLGNIDARQADINAFIHIPIFALNGKGIVGMGEGGDEEKGAVILIAGNIIELAPGGEDHFLIEVDLVGADSGARAQHRIHRMIPMRAMIGPRPIGRPAEIGGVDVCRQPFFKAVHLIGTNEMHLAR